MAHPQKSQSVQGQILEINVVGCCNLTNKEWFSRQDPYVVIEYSGQKFRTRTDTDGGKNPSFNETIKLPLIEGLRDVNAHVWNSNTIERDDYIGTTKILLNKVLESGYDDSPWSLKDSMTGKSAGTLKLILHYECAKNKPAAKPDHGTSGYGAPAGAQGYCYGQAAPGYPQYPAAPAYQACHTAHHPHQAAPAPVYPPVPGFNCAPQAQAQAYIPVYQAPPPPPPAHYPPQPVAYVAPAPPPPPPAHYPPQPVAYVAPAPPAQPHYYHSISAPACPSAPPAPYPQAYPHYRGPY